MCMKFLRFPIKTLDGSYTVQEKPLGPEGTPVAAPSAVFNNGAIRSGEPEWGRARRAGM